MPAVYDKLGLRFQYPENWTLETDDNSPEKPSVSVYSPGGAFWTVIKHPSGTEPAELATAAMQAMKQEYDELDSAELSEEFAGIEFVGYDLNFYCLDLTNTAWIRAGRSDSATLLFICQAEDREFEKMSPVFRAMMASLLNPQK